MKIITNRSDILQNKRVKKLKDDVFWVGGIDWDIRNFHGYSTNRGTTYNAYLIVDEKITLIDTVKHYLFDEMKNRIETIVNLTDIEYIISNHVEMDHSGSLPYIRKLCPDAKIITSTNGKKGLERHYKKQWDLTAVRSGDTINIGQRTLQFAHVPMVHWPDSMVTYSPYDKILFPNDAFGQHIASSERFDDEFEWGILREEAAKYYANIVTPYGEQVKNALNVVSKLDFDMIAPSHGIIWRSMIKQIVNEYSKWANHITENRAVIVYDTMWGSTEKIAYALLDGLTSAGVSVMLRNLNTCHISDIMMDVLDSKMILIGSPTLNNSMLPSMGGFLTYMKGLRPQNRIGFVFGSYGWGGQAVKDIENIISKLGWSVPVGSINIPYIPDDEELEKVRDVGVALGTILLK